MPTTRVTGRGPKSPVDEEFLNQLYRGSELLAQGKAHEARQHLERAHQLQPRNEKSQNLLGLAFF
jgi:Flp pilus assembly protein TadD